MVAGIVSFRSQREEQFHFLFPFLHGKPLYWSYNYRTLAPKYFPQFFDSHPKSLYLSALSFLSILHMYLFLSLFLSLHLSLVLCLYRSSLLSLFHSNCRISLYIYVSYVYIYLSDFVEISIQLLSIYLLLFILLYVSIIIYSYLFIYSPYL